jgi:hypothetical protein
MPRRGSKRGSKRVSAKAIKIKAKLEKYAGDWIHCSMSPNLVVKKYNVLASGFPWDTVKPYGLWFAKGNEWLEHVKEYNNFKPCDYMYKLESIDKLNILYIENNLDSIKEFKKKYCSRYGDVRWWYVYYDYDGIYMPSLYGYIATLSPSKFQKMIKSIPFVLTQLDVDSLAIWNTDNISIKRIDK